jgi:hypothetical protein
MINLTTQFRNADGAPLLHIDKPVLLRDQLTALLLATPEALHPLDEATKLKRYELFKRVKSTADTIEFSADDVAFIKAAAAPLMTPLALGQLHEMLDARN